MDLLLSTQGEELVATFNRHKFLQSLILVVFALSAIGLSACTSSTQAVDAMSPQQINVLMKSFASKLEKDRTWISKFGPLHGGKLFCDAKSLGTGLLKGHRGVFAWVACAGIHKEVSATGEKIAVICTGGASPGWIQLVGNTISYKVSVAMPDSISLQASAPPAVKHLMDSAYKLEPSQYKILLARATKELKAGKLGGDSEKC